MTDSLAIQPHGFLLVLTPDWIVEHASVNVDDYLGESHVTMIGEPLGRFVMAEPLHDLRNHLGGAQRIFGTRLTEEPRRFDLVIRRQDGFITFTGVDGSSQYGEAFGAVGSLAAGLNRARLVEDSARRMRALTGYDRVIFTLGGDCADSIRTGVPMPPCTPGECGRMELTADADAEPVALFPAPAEAIDCVIASPPAAEREALRAAGAAAMLRLPLLIGGACAGAFHCYHRGPRIPSLEIQAAAELFAQMIGLMVETERWR